MKTAQSSTTVAATALELTEFKLGWRALLVAIIGVASSVNATLLYGFGAMVVPLEKAFGWTPAQLQPAIAFLFLGAIISSQVVGGLNQRFGLRRVTLCSLVALACGFLLLTQMGESIWTLYLGFIGIAWAGFGTLQVTWTYFINLWFERNRGLALALTLSGTGIAAIIMPPLITSVTQRWNWQAGFIAMALMAVLLAIPLVFFWMTVAPAQKIPAQASGGQSQPPVDSAGLTFREGCRSRKFWACNIALTLVVSAILGIVTNAIPMLRSRGMSAMEASQIFSSFGISLILGRVVVGYLVDRIWAPGVAAVTLLLPAVGCILFSIHELSSPMLVVATLLVGVGAGAEFDLAAFLVSRYFGLREYGRLFGLHLGLITAGAAASPLLFGVMFRMTGSYSVLLIYCTGCFIIGAVLLLSLGRYPSWLAKV